MIKKPAKKIKIALKPVQKPAKKVKINKKSSKTAKNEPRTLAEIIQSWDTDQGPLPSLYDTASHFDEVCNRLEEVKHLLDAASEDMFEVENQRVIQFMIMAERIIGELSTRVDSLTMDLYRINRSMLASK